MDISNMSKEQTVAFLEAAGIRTQQPKAIFEDSRIVAIVYEILSIYAEQIETSASLHVWSETYQHGTDRYVCFGAIGDGSPYQIEVFAD